MTAPARLPHPSDVTIICPKCHRRTVATSVPVFHTPLGLRRYRRCGACGQPFSTLEIASGPHHIASLPVPARTPSWLLRLCARLARAGAWVAG